LSKAREVIRARAQLQLTKKADPRRKLRMVGPQRHHSIACYERSARASDAGTV